MSAAAIFVVAVGLRLAASRGDLVLDEVWTLALVADTDSAWKILMLGTDNNHILNTLVVYALGLSAPFYAYRLPAVLAGSVALIFGYLLARREGTTAGLVVLILLGFSFPLILFCTEARGYGYLACCTLAAWWGLEEYLDRPRPWALATFAVSASLGFLAHLTFAFAFAGFGVYSLIRLLPRRRGWEKCLSLHALPLLVCVLLYVAFVRGMGIGGGTQYPLGTTLVATFSLLAGGPERGWGAMFSAGVAAIAIAASLASSFRRSRARGLMLVTTLFAAPAVVLCFSWNEVVYPRYFLVPMLFAYVAAGIALARAPSFAGSWGVWLVMAGFAACHLAPVAGLIATGRGEYARAVRWMAEHSEGNLVTVASDHDFRNQYMAHFYAARDHEAYADRGRRFVYFDQAHFLQEGSEGTEWFLLHSFSGDPPHPAKFTTPTHVHYALVQVFPCENLSGWTWWLYQRQGEQPPHE